MSLTLSLGPHQAAMVAYQENFACSPYNVSWLTTALLKAPKIEREIERLTQDEIKRKLADAGITEGLGLQKFKEALEKGKEWAVQKHLALFGFTPPPPSSTPPTLGIFEMLGLSQQKEVKEIGPLHASGDGPEVKAIGEAHTEAEAEYTEEPVWGSL